MICKNCCYQTECEWFHSYQIIVDEIHNGIGTDTQLGQVLIQDIELYPLRECEYFSNN